MFGALTSIIVRETLLNWRQGGAGWLVLVFYLMTVTLFPFGVGPDPEILTVIASGIIWAAALLSAVLSLDRMFSLDVEDGSMDLLLLSPVPLGVLALGKALAHWLNTLGPVIIITPVMALLLNLNTDALGTLILALLLGTPALSFFGSIAAALTAGIKRGGVLIPILVLPLYIPTLIFGATAVAEALRGSGGEVSNLLFLAGISVFSMALGPVAAAGALRVTMD